LSSLWKAGTTPRGDFHPRARAFTSDGLAEGRMILIDMLVAYACFCSLLVLTAQEGEI
jgi:hypothetical protein